VLFGSIMLYSVANILNGLVTSVEQYSWLRFIAGVGLAAIRNYARARSQAFRARE